MGRNFEDSHFLGPISRGNPTGSGVPEAVAIGIEGFQGIKRSDSELNIEAFFCMSDEGEGECSDGDIRTKAGKFADGDNAATPFPEKLSERGLPVGDGGRVAAFDQSSVDNFSSCGQLTRLRWSPTPLPTGSSPASVGSGLTSGCKDSKDQSDDDDMKTEAGPSEQSLGANEVKRMRRMVSNRESARRSRRRKQAHLTELESQVDQLRGENSTLYKQLTEISQQCENAATNNHALKSDVEALRATVKMAQELVAKGPLASIINHKLVNQSPLAPALNSWNLCRSLDNLAVIDSDFFHEISALPGTPTFGTESASSINIKSDGSVPVQQPLSIEQLQNCINGRTDDWVFDASPISKRS